MSVYRVRTTRRGWWCLCTGSGRLVKADDVCAQGQDDSSRLMMSVYRVRTTRRGWWCLCTGSGRLVEAGAQDAAAIRLARLRHDDDGRQFVRQETLSHSLAPHRGRYDPPRHTSSTKSHTSRKALSIIWYRGTTIISVSGVSTACRHLGNSV